MKIKMTSIDSIKIHWNYLWEFRSLTNCNKTKSNYHCAQIQIHFNFYEFCWILETPLIECKMLTNTNADCISNLAYNFTSIEIRICGTTETSIICTETMRKITTKIILRIVNWIIFLIFFPFEFWKFPKNFFYEQTILTFIYSTWFCFMNFYLFIFFCS